MLSLWRAKIKAEIPGPIWPYSDEEVCRHLFEDGTKLTTNAVNRLRKYYYFATVHPADPIIARQNSANIVKIHPGICRFIGSSFRKDIWLDALIYTIQPDFSNPNVRWIQETEIVDRTDSIAETWKHFDKIGDRKNQPIYADHLYEDSKHARIEIVSETKGTIIINEQGDWTIRENMSDHNDLIIPTLRSLFKKIKKLQD